MAKKSKKSGKRGRLATAATLTITVVSQVRELAQEHPEKAAEIIDRVESFVALKAPDKHAATISRGSGLLRRGLGLPDAPKLITASPAPTYPTGARSVGTEPTDLELDPELDGQWHAHEPDDASPTAPNPMPGTGDDPQPRHSLDGDGPMTPGQHH